MNILVIDGQGGGLGRQLVQEIKSRFPEENLVAVGTNAIASQAMHKAGAERVATGENAVIVNCRNADVVVGPIGIVIADSLWGEVSPAMALAVSRSNAVRVLLPMNLCDNYVAGLGKQSVSQIVEDALSKIAEIAGGECRG